MENNMTKLPLSFEDDGSKMIHFEGKAQEVVSESSQSTNLHTTHMAYE